MVTISAHACSRPADLTFQVPAGSAAFAGSRSRSVPQHITVALVRSVHAHGFSLMTGCAPGTDASFRSVLAQPEYARDSLIACAFPSRARRLGTRSLAAVTVVPHGLTAGQALARRTVWMVRRASFLVLFPEHPHTGRWGPGSTLAFRTAAHNLTPTFVAASAAPPDSLLYRIVPSQLFATVTGFWTVPHPVFTGGPCDEV